MGARELEIDAAGMSRLEPLRTTGPDEVEYTAVLQLERAHAYPSPVTVELAEDPDVLLRVAWLPSGPWFTSAVRRWVDIILASVGLMLALPVLLLLVTAIKVSSPGPALFRHRRIGRYGVMFDCWKLRTMYQDAGDSLASVLASNPQLAREFAEKHKIEDDPRVTPLGRWLRILNLDELPQLWNIIRGDMGLVGPRPIVLEEVPRYGQALGSVLSVRPGLTGLWQVSGRSETTYEERVRLDLTYVQSRSPWMDLKILARTVVYVFKPSSNGAR